MASVNKVFLIGNLGNDPEYKFSPNGVGILKFSIATSEKVKKGEDWEDKTDWHNIVAFGKTAEFVQEYLKKGMSVWVEGKLANNVWEDENGVKKYSYNIIAHKITILTPKGKQEDTAKEPEQKQGSKESKSGDPDLPF